MPYEPTPVSTLDILTNAVTAPKLSAAVQDLLPSLELTGTDDTDGTGSMQINVLDAAGNALTGRYLIRTWIADADFSEPDAQTDFNAVVGEIMRQLEANADYEVISQNSPSRVTMEINTTGAKTVYVMAELDGKIYSEQLDITGP